MFAAEPLADSSPLWDLPNVIVSPHMAGAAGDWCAELVDLFVDNLTRYRQGHCLRNVVDKQRGYVPGDAP